MRKISIYTCAILCAMFSNNITTKNDKNATNSAGSLTTSYAGSSLGKFESSKSQALTSPNEHLETSNNNWDEVIDYLEKALKLARQGKSAHASIHKFAKIGEIAQENLHNDKNVSGKSRSATNDFKKTTSKNQSNATGKLNRVLNLTKNAHKAIDDTVTESKKHISEDSKKMVDTQQKLANEDAKEASGNDQDKHHKNKSNTNSY